MLIKDSELIPFVPKKSSLEDQGEKEEDEETLVAVEEAEGLHHVFPSCFYPQKGQGYHKEPVSLSEEKVGGGEGGLRHVFPSCFYLEEEAPVKSLEEEQGLRHIFPSCFYPLKQLNSAPRPSKPSRSLGLPHHSTLASLRNAAQSCEICALIEQSVDRVRKILEEANKDPDFVAYDENGAPTFEFSLSKRPEGEDGFLVWSRAEKGPNAFMLGAIGYCVVDGRLLSFFLFFSGKRLDVRDLCSEKSGLYGLFKSWG